MSSFQRLIAPAYSNGRYRSELKSSSKTPESLCPVEVAMDSVAPYWCFTLLSFDSISYPFRRRLGLCETGGWNLFRRPQIEMGSWRVELIRTLLFNSSSRQWTPVCSPLTQGIVRLTFLIRRMYCPG